MTGPWQTLNTPRTARPQESGHGKGGQRLWSKRTMFCSREKLNNITLILGMIARLNQTNRTHVKMLEMEMFILFFFPSATVIKPQQRCFELRENIAWFASEQQ